ncbi:hypothetical protein [Chitinolyticbacter meiyuanensis]|uniref:hypothetical protein n=1 Tax=Chitinolyticbacter meiyuanensis TaxID=682798 RepID=UPI0011E5B632|nr:hypothetical protein [Chitinolyticbacter meiyuanensis]
MKLWSIGWVLALLGALVHAVEPADYVGDYWASLGYDRHSYALIIDAIEQESAKDFVASGRFGVSCKGLSPVTVKGRKEGNVWRVSFDYRDLGRGEFSGVPKGRIAGEWIGTHGKGQFTLLRGGLYATCPELKREPEDIKP